MNKKIIVACTGILLAGALSTNAQEMVVAADKVALHQQAAKLRRLSAVSLPGNAGHKPTGDLQRLVQTVGESGTPGQSFYRGHDFRYQYTGNGATTTLPFGPYPVTGYDSAYSTINDSYRYQRFHSSGSLAKSFRYDDTRVSSGPNAGQRQLKVYDTEGRLTLDSMYQTGQVGANLSITNRYAYDGNSRLTFSAYRFAGYDPGAWIYAYAISRFYEGNDTLPAYDSVLTVDDQLVKMQFVRHHYDNSGRLLADSAWLTGAASATEVVQYSYPAAGNRVALTSRFENNTWLPFQRETIIKDSEGRITRNQMEVYQAGTWYHYYRNDFQFTYPTQPDTLPSLLIVYSSDNNTVYENSWEIRKFNDAQLVDTLTFYIRNNISDPMTMSSHRIFKYNTEGNLIQDYMHYYLASGQEISGYYTDYFYERAVSNPAAFRADPQVSLYPNPATHNVFVHVTGGKGPLRMTVSDVMGRVQLEQRLDKQQHAIDVAKLLPGMYWARFTDQEGGSKICRFVKN